jgi:hypothetical protein
MENPTTEISLGELPGLSLSSQRVVHSKDEGSTIYKHSILLRNITSCEVIYKRYYRFLYYSLLFLALGLLLYRFINHDLPGFVLLIAIDFICFGCCLILFFFDTRRAICIKSANSQILIQEDFTPAQALEFVDKVDRAIIKYVN